MFLNRTINISYLVQSLFRGIEHDVKQQGR